MSDEKKFEAFKRQLVEETERLYGAESREKYGGAEVDASNAKTMGLTLEQYQEYERLGEEILDKLSAAVAAGADAAAFAPLKTLSRFFIVMAMAAIGLNTDLVKLVRSGAKPILMGLICWACIAAASLAMQHTLGLW